MPRKHKVIVRAHKRTIAGKRRSIDSFVRTVRSDKELKEGDKVQVVKGDLIGRSGRITATSFNKKSDQLFYLVNLKGRNKWFHESAVAVRRR